MTNEFEQSFESIIGYEEIKDEMYQMCDIIKHPEHYQPLGAVAPRGLLLYGEPGLGKTSIATCLMNAIGFPVFTCRKDLTGNEFLQSIKKAFDDAAANAPAFVFLDDFDKFANEDFLHPNAQEYVTIQSCIDENKDKEIYVIATANNLSNVPESLLRAGRFDRTVEVTQPSHEETRKIVKHYLMEKALMDDVAAEDIATLLYDSNCAEVKARINEAAVLAGYERAEKVTKEHILEACLRKLYDAPKCLEPYGPKAKKRIAVHEAGHAVAHYIADAKNFGLVSVRRTTSNTAGFVSYIRPDEEERDFEAMESQVVALLAGKAATELVTGAVDTGCSHDLRRAGAMIDSMVTTLVVNGFKYFDYSGDTSPTKLSNQEGVVAEKLEYYYGKAYQLLADHRAFLDGIVEALMQKDVLTASEIEAIYLKTEKGCGQNASGDKIASDEQAA